MTTMTIRRREVVSARNSQVVLAQTSPGALSSGQKTKRPVTERHAHEDWKQRIEEDWQRHLKAMQKYVGELVRNNQQQGMALTTANDPKRRYGNAIDF
jgi:L-lactate utilization protein LutB